MMKYIQFYNKHWNELNLLSNALIPCSNISEKQEKEKNNLLYPNMESFEMLILSIIENIYLCDKIELIIFLLLMDDINT